MNEHLSAETLSALADGELNPSSLEAVQHHLAGCPACTSQALAASLLKSAAARAPRYAPPASLAARLAEITAQPTSPRRSPSYKPLGLAIAALLLIGVATLSVVRVVRYRNDATEAAVEVTDQHIATLASNIPPQVISSDRHTVKPWFQGKLPFSFNLPQNLPADVTLDGANLTYLHGQPTAQLLYSIGKHHVSLFLQQPGAAAPQQIHSGFTVTSFSTQTLSATAVSDADPARLNDLLDRFYRAQQ